MDDEKSPLANDPPPAANDPLPLAWLLEPMAKARSLFAFVSYPKATDIAPFAMVLYPPANDQVPILAASHCAPTTEPAAKGQPSGQVANDPLRLGVVLDEDWCDGVSARGTPSLASTHVVSYEHLHSLSHE